MGFDWAFDWALAFTVVTLVWMLSKSIVPIGRSIGR
jgi:hypothetical protein